MQIPAKLGYQRTLAGFQLRSARDKVVESRDLSAKTGRSRRRRGSRRLWDAKTRFTSRDHSDLQVKPSGDAPQG
jgi:hypothetical protein